MLFSTNHSYFSVFSRNYGKGLIILAIFTILSVAFGFIVPEKYSSVSQVLLIQKQSNIIDAYTAFRAGERAGKNIAQISQSNSFQERVFQDSSMLKMTEKFMSLTESERQKLWEKSVVVKLKNDTTILEIKTFGSNREEARSLNQAVHNVVLSRSADYLGSEQNIIIKEIDTPRVGDKPSQPDFFVLGLSGVIMGILFSQIYFLRKMN